jgi:hypothetical protein
VEFEGEGPIPNLLEREYNFNDKILRYLTYRYTKNKIIARKVEAESKKTQPVTADIPKILPEKDSDETEVVELENTEVEEPEEVSTEEVSAEEKDKEAENA